MPLCLTLTGVGRLEERERPAAGSFINAVPGRSRCAALTHPGQGRHRPLDWQEDQCEDVIGLKIPRKRCLSGGRLWVVQVFQAIKAAETMVSQPRQATCCYVRTCNPARSKGNRKRARP